MLCRYGCHLSLSPQPQVQRQANEPRDSAYHIVNTQHIFLVNKWANFYPLFPIEHFRTVDLEGKPSNRKGSARSREQEEETRGEGSMSIPKKRKWDYKVLGYHRQGKQGPTEQHPLVVRIQRFFLFFYFLHGCDWFPAASRRETLKMRRNSVPGFQDRKGVGTGSLSLL